MTIDTADRAREKGIALVYVGVFLVPLLICTGLAVDLGRGYLVRATLAKAVDAAALEAARNITAADPSQWQTVATRIFDVNFPPGFLGATRSEPDLHPPTIGPDGSHIIEVTAKATVPTTFMRLAGRDSLEVTAAGTATRRVVDLALAIDRSASLSNSKDEVKAAAMEFVGKFDHEADRIALITFSSGTTVPVQMRSGGARGFDLATIDAAIASMPVNGATATAEALYQAWDQLRSVPYSTQSGLRIVVLFTDGSPNSFPAQFRVRSPFPGSCSPSTFYPYPVTGTLGTWDYPAVPGNNSTTKAPDDVGLFDTGAPDVRYVPPTDGNYHTKFTTDLFKQNPCIPVMPLTSYQVGQASGMTSSFPLTGRRQLNADPGGGGYTNYWWNANHAARNLAETVADKIRSDADGLYPIRIYTLGLGDLLLAGEGDSPLEKGADILKGIANDPVSPDHKTAQLDGQFFYAADPAQLKLAFSKVADEVFRLSR